MFSEHTHMRERITLTLDPAVTLRARQVAKSRGTSLSRLIENRLRELPGGAGPERPARREAFSARWAGKGKLRTGDDPRLQKLLGKYG